MSTAERNTKSGFTADERAAMRQRAAELKKQERKGKSAEERAAIDRQDLLDAIAEMDDSDRSIAQGIDDIVQAEAPQLASKTWYGFPAYTRDGKVVVFFKAAGKYKDRYATLGFESAARLDDGQMWPTSYAILSLGEGDRERIAELVRRAAG
ncbi:DUF1801 domain-containing protein [Microbacterium sp. BK668]|uniref:DUF1801 domain-containing protein n=1 Tax=Microbacterium sp. BK668 TaxID=2512118 RepID=UPI00105D4566|nr:DUF1801 domain-containing protein [Microbacterium sp. BK668]